MPFWERSAIEQRGEFVAFASQVGTNPRELCPRFGVSPETGYKWLRRYRVEGGAGLVDRSRRPHHSPGRASGVAVWDVDPDEGGFKTVDAIVNEADKASTLVALTARSGVAELGRDGA